MSNTKEKIRTSRPNLYDYLKVIAVISMITDHIGFFFFPEYQVLRVIGRVAFPLFLFLVGYNGSFRRRNSLRVYAIVIQGFIRAAYFGGYSDIFYLNILGVIALVRLILGYVKNNNIVLLMLFFFGIFFVWQTREYADYGTISLSFAILGYRAGKYKEHRGGYLIGAGLLAYHMYFMIESRGFDTVFTPYLIAVGCILFLCYMFLYKHNYSLRLRPNIDALIYYLSSHALEIYFIHATILVILYGILQIF